MTREEAKRVLEFDLDHTHNDESKEALRMAIKALEQKPCDDCIRKSTVINILEYHLEHNADVDLTDIIDEIKEEPIYLNECKDAVRREEVLDLCDSKDPEYNVRFFKEDVECLPPVYPEPKTGHWIETAEEYYKAVNEYGGGVNKNTPYFVDDIACSECLAMYSVIDNETERFDHCPSCGARMVEPQESEDNL